MTFTRFTFAIASIVFSGCAAYELPPSPVNHPANPQAMAAPQRAPSKTLAYTSADTPSVSAAAAEDGHEVIMPLVTGAIQRPRSVKAK